MKKSLIALLFLVGFLLSTGFSQAQGVGANPTSIVPECVDIANNLQKGDRDANKNGEVSKLQSFLQARGYLNSASTGYSGAMTLKAVVDFQNANGITPASGYVGSKTKAQIKALTCNGPIASKYDAFAQCLASNKLTMYGASWAPHVDAQKALFGSSFQYVPYVECSSSPVPGQTQECIDKGITSYPTWIDRDNRKYEGDQSLARLSKISGCQLPNTSSSITVLSPNGGEAYRLGDEVSIRWQTSNQSVGNVNIHLDSYVDCGNDNCPKSSSVIANNVPNTGVYNWTIGYPFVAGCTSGMGYSFLSGLSCNGSEQLHPQKIVISAVNNRDIQDQSDNYFTITSSTISPPLPAGCATNVGYSLTTGLPCFIATISATSITSTSAVFDGYLLNYAPSSVYFIYRVNTNPLPPGVITPSVVQLANAPFSTTIYNLTPNTEYQFEACMQYLMQNTCAQTLTFRTSGTTGGPTISGVSGPQTLNVGQQGTWTVTASDPSGGNLSYSVVWGDEGSAVMSTGDKNNLQQTATFTHVYSQSGVYTPTFTVTNTTGQSAQASLDVNVGPQAPFLTLTANPTSVPYNGSSTLTWSSVNVALCNATGGSNGWAGYKYPFGTFNTGPLTRTTTYNMVCSRDGGTIDASVTVTVGNIRNRPPILNSTTIPRDIHVGQPATFSFSATDPDNDNLSWGISWGDATGEAGTCPSPFPNTTYSPTHTWNTAGVYRVQYSVSDCRGGTASGNFEVNVGEVVKCDYAAPPPGCGYIIGPNYDATNGCGMVLNCQTLLQSEKVLGAFDSSSCGQFMLTLKMGMNNKEVQCLQKLLNTKGFRVPGVEAGMETTYFGEATEIALKVFQTSNGLLTDGVFGANSRTVLQGF